MGQEAYEAEWGWLPGDNCSSPPRGDPAAAAWNCSAHHAAYQQALDAHVAAVAAAHARFTAAVTGADAYASLLRGNLTALASELNKANALLAARAFREGTRMAPSVFCLPHARLAACAVCKGTRNIPSVFFFLIFLCLRAFGRQLFRRILSLP